MTLPRHHLIIAGTGRSGTTFLVQLLTKLGLDTGFRVDAKIDDFSHAGLEKDPRSPKCPYVVKNPGMAGYLGDLLDKKTVIVDHAIIPMRRLVDAADSRRRVTNAGRSAGGIVGKNPAEQEAILAKNFYATVFALVRHDVPITFLEFPRLATDCDYLRTRLIPICPWDRMRFNVAFGYTSKPDLIHDFNPPPKEK